MPQYLSPGVYVEEIDAGPKPIEGVSTSICGAVGMTLTGPSSGKPVLVTSFYEFTRIFGGYWPPQDEATVNRWTGLGGAWWQFPLSVQAFFDNGGQQLYVKRVVATDAAASSAPFGTGLVSQLIEDTAADSATLRLSHVIGAKVGLNVQLGMGGAVPLPTPYKILTLDESTSTITVSPKVSIALSTRRGDYVVLEPISMGKPVLKVQARDSGVGGNGIQVRIDPMVGNSYNMLADSALSADPAKVAVVLTTATITPAPTSLIDVDMTTDPLKPLAPTDRVLLRGAEYEVAAFTPGIPGTPGTPAIPGTPGTPATPAIPATATTPAVAAVAAVPAVPAVAAVAAVPAVPAVPAKLGLKLTATIEVAVGDRITQIRPANNLTAAPHDTLNLWGAGTLYDKAIVELSNGQEKEVALVKHVAGNKVTFEQPLTIVYHEGHRARVIEARVSAQNTPVNGTAVVETFSNLRLIDDKTPSVIDRMVNDRSKLVRITGVHIDSPSDLKSFPTPATGTWAALIGGDDKLGELSVDAFIGTGARSGERTGIQALEDIEDISVCIVPGIWAPDVHSALITHCELLRDRFAVLDPPDGLGIEEIRDYRAPLNTKYAALYYPWVTGRDPVAAKDVPIAPSGHMAGIYARVDNDRGVHKAPANETIRSIAGLTADVNKREHDRLNPSNINALRFFPERGFLVYGARCVTADSEWKYINVRRLFIFVEKSIERGTQWVVFEPNDEPLWAKVRQSITNFLTTVWRGGALQGGKAAEAFFVQCDRKTMTQDDIDNGRLICVIGIAPVKPAEFVIFRIQQKTLDQTGA
jgi:phage tail sheath protein FI